MTCHFSVRNITYTAFTDGVQVVVETDVKVDLHLRLTSHEPWIHKQPRLRRGVWYADDVRFCFTVYDDFTQYEQYETYTHTFWMENWPVCTTKWLYFWGVIAGQHCLSTSPIFGHHNDGYEPIPGADNLYTMNSITPEKIAGLGINVWTTHSLAGQVSPQATGAILVAVNDDPGQTRYFGVRAKGQPGFSTGGLRQQSMTGAFVKLDQNLEFDMFVGFFGVVYIYVMGFTGPNVVWFDTPIDLHPTIDGSWVDIDVSAYCPDAQAILLSTGAAAVIAVANKTRVFGSLDNRWCNSYHSYPCIGLSADHKFQRYLGAGSLASGHTHLLGYIKSEWETHVDAKDVTPLNAGVWEPVNVADLVVRPSWVSLQLWESTGANLYGMRKSGTFFNEKQHSSGGDWMLVHADPSGICDLWLPLIGRKFYLHGEITREVV